MNGLVQDIRYALRQLRKNPGFTFVAIVTLALGIGANTGIFSVIENVVLRALPFGAPDRLVWLNGKFPQSDEAGVSPPDFRDYRVDNKTFDRMVAMAYAPFPSNLAGDKPEQVLSTIASANFFDCLGIRPLLGRDFILSDEQTKLPQVAILGYGIWKRDFGTDPGIVGRNIRMDGQNLTVVGVLPSDLPLLTEAQVWLPTPMLNPGMNIRMGHSLKALGRIKKGVTLKQSQTDLDAIALGLAQQYPDTNKGWFMRERPLKDFLIGPVRPALLLMWGAVALLLLIACVNVANLLLARSVSRQKEFALRAALGAGRGRMIKQVLTESTILSLAGWALGVLAAAWGVHAVRTLASLDVPRLREIQINPMVLAFTLGVSLLTGLIFGLVPALQVSGGEFLQGLKESGRAYSPSAHKRLSSVLVVGEIAMSLMLLVSAGLLLKSFWRLIHVDPGFQTEHVITSRLSLNQASYGGYGDPTYRARFWQQFEDKAKSLPGVEAVGATSELPLSGEHSDNPFHIPGRNYGPSEFDDAEFRQIAGAYLSAMEIPLLKGRVFDDHDNVGSAGVMLVNEAFMKRYFNGQEVLGKHLELMGDQKPSREIVGVVGNINHSSLSEAQQPEMFVPYAQYATPTIDVVVRGAADPANIDAALRAQISSIDKDETLSAIRSMDDVLETSVSQPRFSSQLVGSFAAIALLLAAIGLYGLMAYSVTQRRNEIGIRIALGATRGDILSLVLKRGSVLALAGIGFGFVASMLATSLLSRMLFGVTARDPATFIAVALVLGGVALVACYIPARHAANVDPMVALRYE